MEHRLSAAATLLFFHCLFLHSILIINSTTTAVTNLSSFADGWTTSLSSTNSTLATTFLQPTSPASPAASAAAGQTPVSVTSLAPAPVNHVGIVRNDGWLIALIVLAGTGILFVFGLEIYIQAKIYGTPLMRQWHSLWLGHVLLFGIFLSYLLMFAYIPYPCFATCGIIRFCTGVCYSLCFSAVLVKLVVILSPDVTSSGVLVVLFLFVWIGQIVVDVQWLIEYPPRVVTVDNTDGARCDPGFVEHVKSLVYVMFLIVLCAFVSMFTGCFGNNVLDGVFIGTSCGLTIAVWVVWILLGYLENSTEWHDPCMAFGLLTTATVLLLFIFLPKIYQLNHIEQSMWDGDEFEPDAAVTGRTEIFAFKGGHDSVSLSTASDGKKGFGSTSDVIGNGGRHFEDSKVLRSGSYRSNGGTFTPIYEEENDMPPIDLNPHALHLQYPATSRSSLRGSESMSSIHSASVGGGGGGYDNRARTAGLRRQQSSSVNPAQASAVTPMRVNRDPPPARQYDNDYFRHNNNNHSRKY